MQYIYSSIWSHMVVFCLDNQAFVMQLLFSALVTAIFVAVYLFRIYFSTLPKRGDMPWLTEEEKRLGYTDLRKAILREKIPIAKIKLKRGTE